MKRYKIIKERTAKDKEVFENLKNGGLKLLCFNNITGLWSQVAWCGDNTIESPFYSIVEGYPLYYIESQQEWSPIKVGDSRPDSDAEALYGSIVHRRELTMDETVFYDNIKYKLNAGTGTLMVSGIGNSEDGVDYYVAKQPLRDKIVMEGGYMYTVYYFDDNHNKLPSQVYFAGLLTNKYDTVLNGKPCLIRC